MSKRIKPLKTMIILSVMVLLGAFGLHSALSGQLDPGSAPGSTMYTLEEIYNFRVWKMMGKTFANWTGTATPRFAIWKAGTPGDDPEFAADDLVLDKETGLIWTRDADVMGGDEDVVNAVLDCRSLDLGDRMGWRIPSIEELSSLLDLSQEPLLPENLFVNVRDDNYYYADLTMAGGLNAFGYGLNMTTGDITDGIDLEADTAYVWCVWGGKSSGF